MRLMLYCYPNRGKNSGSRWGRLLFDKDGYAELSGVGDDAREFFQSMGWLVGHEPDERKVVVEEIVGVVESMEGAPLEGERVGEERVGEELVYPEDAIPLPEEAPEAPKPAKKVKGRAKRR